MDLKLHLGVLWRFRWLLVGGLVLASALAFLSVFKVSSSGVSYRQSETFDAREILFVNQPGFPYGWATQPNAIDKTTGLPIRPTVLGPEPLRPTRLDLLTIGQRGCRLQENRRAGACQGHLRRGGGDRPDKPGSTWNAVHQHGRAFDEPEGCGYPGATGHTSLRRLHRQPTGRSRYPPSTTSGAADRSPPDGCHAGRWPEVHVADRSLPRRPDRGDRTRVRAREPEAPRTTSCGSRAERSRGGARPGS